MNKLRIGIIGAGRIGKVHAANLARSPEVTLQAVTDIQQGAAKDLAQRFSIPSVYESPTEMLKDKNIDAVLICSSTDTHADLIEAAAAQGKHIFCEKPVDLTVRKVKSALAAVEKAKVVLQVGFNRRFDPNFRKIAELVRSEALGAPHLARISSRDPAPPPPEYVKVSGGIFLDMTIHDFDMARFVMNDEVESVTAQGAVLVDPRIGAAGDVDTATVVLKFRSGALCTIDNSRKATYGYDQRLEVFGAKACASTGNTGPNQVQVWSESGQHQDPPHYFFLEKYEQAFMDEMRDFVSAVQKKSPPPVTGRDGLEALRIALAATRSLQEGRTVLMTEIEA
jgi:myo-inositol 2-dehydrogenase / D-chiro-inositol 1-dehydrogenase